MKEQGELTIGDLAKQAGVTPRTIRYYTAEGLLPQPSTQGRIALYGREHLLRLRAIAHLKGLFLPLGEIRRRLEGLSLDEMEALPVLSDGMDAMLAQGSVADGSQGAAAYVRRLLEKRLAAPPSSLPAPAPMFSRSMAGRAASPPATGEQWERLSLAPDLELHVRIPHSARADELIGRILEAIREPPKSP